MKFMENMPMTRMALCALISLISLILVMANITADGKTPGRTYPRQVSEHIREIESVEHYTIFEVTHDGGTHTYICRGDCMLEIMSWRK